MQKFPNIFSPFIKISLLHILPSPQIKTMETSQKVGPSQSPSFNTYSSQSQSQSQSQSHRNQTLTDIAARVIHELNFPHSDPFHDHFYDHPYPNTHDDDGDDEESEFEFTVLCGADNNPSSPISADEIFSNGQIKPLYPNPPNPGPGTGPDPPARLPLRRLLIEERENSNSNSTESCSSSEGDELEGVPPESYCVWDPTKKKNDGVLLKKKSKSAGSHSKRWRIRDFLYRSNSDGGKEGNFVFSQRDTVGPTPAEKRRGSEGKRRLDVIGFFSNANGISRTVRPF